MHRGDEDDPTALRGGDKPLGNGLSAQERTRQVDLQGASPVVRHVVQHARPVVGAGAGDEAPEGSQPRSELLDGRLRTIGVV